jgi:hypothetical protein
MRAGVLDEGLARVGSVESGRAGPDFVVFSREVVAASRYLVLVGLSAPTSALNFEPARIVGDEAPFVSVAGSRSTSSRSRQGS